MSNMKIYTLFALLLGASTPASSTVDDLLYPFGPSHEDTTSFKSDDGSSPSISISTTFHFFETAYSSLFVNHNGLVSFILPVSSFTSQSFPLLGLVFIAPFWADVHNGIAGDIYYRESWKPEILQRATADVNSYFPGVPFTATWTFIATWDRVAYYGSQSSLVNTFQAVLISDGNHAFVLLNYGQIQWTTGTASGGNALTGLGGTPAQAGFNSGSSLNYFNVPGSRTADILNISSTTNINKAGRWAFRVDTFQAAGGCVYNARFASIGQIFWLESNCQTRCECSRSGDVNCAAQTCSQYESCDASSLLYSCHALPPPPPPQTCHAIGDPHYKTFDGTYYDFQGTCTYILSKVCQEDGGLAHYMVEAKNEYRGNTHVSWTRMVRVTTYGYVITMNAESSGTVLVNGTIVTLPVSLSNGHLIVHQSGNYAVLQTDFGLTVTYDMYSSLYISLTYQYRGKVCGLCGNYNGVAGDDFIFLNGSLAAGPYPFAVNWISGDGRDCSHGDSSIVCDNESITASTSPCRIIQDSSGPFAACHSVIDPSTYFTSCLFDHCITGDTSVMCHSIQSYVATCQAANVTISSWRTDAFCAMPCLMMPNSHYEMCGRRCLGSCATSIIDPSLCEPTCVEGCFCDSGYLRSGDRCIPESQCGCEHEGLYYDVGDLVWLSGCSQRCSCVSHGNLVCANASCNAQQQCALKDGRLGCQEMLTTCTVSGDPHYYTFDGSLAHFQGSCAYEIVRVCDSAASFQFRVVAENRHRGTPTVSFVSRVEIWFQSSDVAVHVVIEQNDIVQVNGVSTVLPSNIGSVASISDMNGAVLLTLPSAEIHYDRVSTLLVRVGPGYLNKLCGMCGNFNGVPGDDKVMPNGNTASTDQEFGNSWKYSGSPAWCTDDVVAATPAPPPSQLTEIERLCGILTERSGPFDECHWHVSPDQYYESCLYDLLYYGMANGMLCKAIEAYERICNIHGVIVPAWRPTAHCPLMDPCDNINCMNNEWCGESTEGYGCFCNENFASQANPNFDLTLACEGSASSVSLARCLLFTVNFPPEIIHLADPTCTGSLVGERLVFPFGNFTQSCGSQLRVNDTHAIYSNAIVGHYIKQMGSVILHEDFINIAFSCAYPLSLDVSFLWAINAAPNSVINVTLPNSLGTYRTNMMLYKDALYSQPATDNPVRLTLSDKAFVYIRVAGLDPNQFVLTFSSCWATSSTDPTSSVRWDLIRNQCSVALDGSLVIQEDGVSDSGKFSFNVFRFIGNSNLVYIHCQIGICNRQTQTCTKLCNGTAKSVIERDDYVSDVVSQGPIILVPRNSTVVSSTSLSQTGGSDRPAASLAALFLLTLWMIFTN